MRHANNAGDFAVLRKIEIVEQWVFADEPNGAWSQIQPQRAWPDNWTSDGFVAYTWANENGGRHIVVVNYSGNQGQSRLPLLFPEVRGKQVRLTDMIGTEVYDRDGSELNEPGLYIDHAPWHFNVFVLRTI